MLPVLTCSLPAQSDNPQQEQPNSQREEKPDSKKLTTKLRIEVTAGETGTPVAAAQVDVSSEDENSKFHRVLRTDQKGIVEVEVPRITVLIQVTAPHWDTGGVRRKLKTQSETIQIKLVRNSAHMP